MLRSFSISFIQKLAAWRTNWITYILLVVSVPRHPPTSRSFRDLISLPHSHFHDLSWSTHNTWHSSIPATISFTAFTCHTNGARRSTRCSVHEAHCFALNFHILLSVETNVIIISVILSISFMRKLSFSINYVLDVPLRQYGPFLIPTECTRRQCSIKVHGSTFLYKNMQRHPCCGWYLLAKGEFDIATVNYKT